MTTAVVIHSLTVSMYSSVLDVPRAKDIGTPKPPAISTICQIRGWLYLNEQQVPPTLTHVRIGRMTIHQFFPQSRKTRYI
jgi:hypothetical protein